MTMQLNNTAKAEDAIKVQVAETATNSSKATFEEDLTLPYTDKSSITISLVHNYSDYRKANMKVFGQRKETIGSSITSTRAFLASKGEIDVYFPAIVGCSPTSPEFITKVQAWLSNIRFVINDNNVSLNTSFIYNHKSDYIRIKKEIDRINEDYDKIDRANIEAIKEGLKIKLDALHNIESTKYKYGRPENVEQYLMYRHCLLYRDIAKDTALINSDSSLRFYIRDEAKEAEKQKKLIEEKSKAMRNFIEINSSDSKFNAVFVAMTVLKGDNLAMALLKDKIEKTGIMMDYINSNPIKFNKLIADKNIDIKAFIETLIARGELIRSEFNQQISTADGTFVGANIGEAITYFNNPANKDVRTAYENKLKLI